MRQFLRSLSPSTVRSYGKALIFLVFFGCIIIQPDRFPVSRTAESLSPATRASYQSILDQKSYQNGDIYLETFHVWEDNEQAVITYVVERGDSLSTIAKQFGTTVDAITEANGLSVGVALRVWQPIEIAFEEGTVVTIAEAMTIRQFADTYDLDYEEFVSINFFEEGADLLEKDTQVFVQLNEKEALKIGLLHQEDFVMMDFELPSEPEVLQPEASDAMIQLVNNIVDGQITDDQETDEDDRQWEENIDEGDLDTVWTIDAWEEYWIEYEQEVIGSDGDRFNPETSKTYEQVIINAEETQAYLEALKIKKQEEIEAKKRAEEEREKAEEAERKAEEARQQQQTEERILQQEEAARQAKLAAEQAEAEVEKIRQSALQAERKAAISAQQAVGIQQDYVAAPMLCGEDECVHDNGCFDKPGFAECAPRDPDNAWVCRAGYREAWWTCVKNLPAPASNGKVLKQWYFNPHKADKRVYGRWPGQCTAWVAYLWAQNYGIDLRRDLGMKWNAAQRWRNAKAVGLTTSVTPVVGSIWWTSRSHGYYGHVVYVDEVYLDEGLMLVTDMNYRGAYQFTQRIESIDRMDGFILPPW